MSVADELRSGAVLLERSGEPVQVSLRRDADRFDAMLRAGSRKRALGYETMLHYVGDAKRDADVVRLLRAAADHADAGDVASFVDDMFELADHADDCRTAADLARFADTLSIADAEGAESLDAWRQSCRGRGEDLARRLLPDADSPLTDDQLAVLLDEVRVMNGRDIWAVADYEGYDDEAHDEGPNGEYRNGDASDEAMRDGFLDLLEKPVPLPSKRMEELTGIVEDVPFLRDIITDPKSVPQISRAIRVARQLLVEHWMYLRDGADPDHPEPESALDIATDLRMPGHVDVEELGRTVSRIDYTQCDGNDNALIHPTRLIRSGYYTDDTIRELLSLLGSVHITLWHLRGFFNEVDKVAHPRKKA